MPQVRQTIRGSSCLAMVKNQPQHTLGLASQQPVPNLAICPQSCNLLAGLAEDLCAFGIVMIIVALVAIERELSKLFIA